MTENQDRDYLNEVELAGFDAQIMGATREACPHPVGSPEWQRWHHGFFTAYVVEQYRRNPWPLRELADAITVH